MYRPYSSKNVRQGDIAICEFHQLRSRGGESPGPGRAEIANEDLPYLGPAQTFNVEFEVPGHGTSQRQLRLWFGPTIVLHQNCEIEYADANDSRLIVAPIVSQEQWSNGPWDLIVRGELPGYFHLEPLDEDAAHDLGLEGPWPRSAVVFASSTCVSRGIVKPNRKMTLSMDAVAGLQKSFVRFTTVRGWGSVDALAKLAGMNIVSISETAETVPGPARLAKVVVQGENDDDEITVAWGLRRTGRSL